MIPEGALDPLTRLVLTNAIYFKGQWATPFNANLTQNAAFTLGSGGQVQVPTMHATDSYRYMQSDGYQVLELPYAGNRLVMDVLLPSAGSGPAGLDVSQLPADLNGWLQGLTSQQVEVSLPKFQMTTQFNLNQPLEALGMTDAFSRQADFSGISTNPLYISSVVHKAFIDVDETGTEAAAATGVGMVFARRCDADNAADCIQRRSSVPVPDPRHAVGERSVHGAGGRSVHDQRRSFRPGRSQGSPERRIPSSRPSR